MSDVIGRGVIEVSADARKLQAGIGEAKKSINELGIATADVSKRSSASIDKYVRSLGVQAVTTADSTRQTELLKLGLRGATDAQLKAADAAMRMTEQHKKWVTVGEQMRTGFLAAASVAAVMAGSLAAMVVSAINAADHLRDLSKSTGITVEDLSGLALAAKQSGGDLDGIAASITKLSQNIGKDTEKFRALGITAKDPLEAFKQLADIFVAIEDPQLRAAVGATALGKSWSSAAPLLSEGGKAIGEMVEKGKQLSGVTKEMADEADKFNDSLAELKATGAGFGAKLASDMLPAFNDITKTIKLAYEESGKLAALWTSMGALGAFLFTDEFASARTQLKGLNEELSDLSLKRSKATGGWFQDLIYGGSPAELDAQIAATKAKILALQKSLLPKADAPKLAGDPLAAGRANAFVKENKAVADHESAYRGLLKTLKEKLLVDRDLTEVNKLQLALDALSIAKRAEITPLQEKELKALAAKVDLRKKDKDALEAYLKVQEQQRAIVQEYVEWKAKEVTAQGVLVRAAEANVAQIEFETTLIGKSNNQRELAIALRTLETSGIDKQSLAYQNLGPQITAALAAQQSKQAIEDLAKKSRDEFTTMWSTVESTGKQAFVGLLSEGKGAFESIGKSIQASVIDLLYQLTARKWLIQIGAGIETSIYGSAASAAAGQAGGSMLGTVGSAAYKWTTGTALDAPAWYTQGIADGSIAAAGAASAASSAAAAAAAAAGSAEWAAAVGGAATIDAGATTALASNPYGWIALAAIAAYAIWSSSDDDEPERPELGITTSGAGGPVGSLAATESGLVAGSPAFWQDANAWLAQLPPTVKTAADNINMVFAPGETAQTAWAAMQAKVRDVAKTLNLSFDDLQKLAPIAAQNARKELSFDLKTVEEQLASTTANLLETFTDLGIAMPSTNAELLAYVKGLDLSTSAGLAALATIEEIAPAFMDMTQAADDAAAETTAAYQVIIDAAETARDANIDQIRDLGEEIADLIAQLDDAAASASEGFADSIRSVQYDVLDSAGQYAFLHDEIASLQDQMLASTDYQTTADLAADINADIMAAWALIPKDQQAARADEFVAVLESNRTLTQTQFAANKADQTRLAEENAALLKTALDEALDTWITAQAAISAAQTTAAATQNAAGQAQLQAASTQQAAATARASEVGA